MKLFKTIVQRPISSEFSSETISNVDIKDKFITEVDCNNIYINKNNKNNEIFNNISAKDKIKALQNECLEKNNNFVPFITRFDVSDNQFEKESNRPNNMAYKGFVRVERNKLSTGNSINFRELTFLSPKNEIFYNTPRRSYSEKQLKPIKEFSQF
jgi:hypothetical protein